MPRAVGHGRKSKVSHCEPLVLATLIPESITIPQYLETQNTSITTQPPKQNQHQKHGNQTSTGNVEKSRPSCGRLDILLGLKGLTSGDGSWVASLRARAGRLPTPSALRIGGALRALHKGHIPLGTPPMTSTSWHDHEHQTWRDLSV